MTKLSVKDIIQWGLYGAMAILWYDMLATRYHRQIERCKSWLRELWLGLTWYWDDVVQRELTAYLIGRATHG